MTSEEQQSTHDWTQALLPAAGAPDDRARACTITICRACGAVRVMEGEKEIIRPCPWYVAEEPDA